MRYEIKVLMQKYQEVAVKFGTNIQRLTVDFEPFRPKLEDYCGEWEVNQGSYDSMGVLYDIEFMQVYSLEEAVFSAFATRQNIDHVDDGMRRVETVNVVLRPIRL